MCEGNIMQNNICIPTQYMQGQHKHILSESEIPYYMVFYYHYYFPYRKDQKSSTKPIYKMWLLTTADNGNTILKIQLEATHIKTECSEKFLAISNVLSKLNQAQDIQSKHRTHLRREAWKLFTSESYRAWEPFEVPSPEWHGTALWERLLILMP